MSDDDSSSVGSDIYEADELAVAQWLAARRVALAGEQRAALVQRVLDRAATGDSKFCRLLCESKAYQNIASIDGAEALFEQAGFVRCIRRTKPCLMVESRHLGDLRAAADCLREATALLAKTLKEDDPQNEGDAANVTAPAEAGPPRSLRSSAPPPPRGGPGGGVAYFSKDCLQYLDHLDEDTFEALVLVASQGKVPAQHDYKYWGGMKNPDTGADEPWRNGTSSEAVTDLAVIEAEEEHKARAEAEDKSRFPTEAAHADMLYSKGIRADFLVSLTSALDLWEWKTWEVVQFLAKPATEGHGRCRFADLPDVQPFTGPAAVFVSHCWAGRWGDLVAAAVAGGRMDRFVWLDVFSVRRGGGMWSSVGHRCTGSGDAPNARLVHIFSSPHHRCASGPATVPTWTFGASSAGAAPCWLPQPRPRA